MPSNPNRTTHVIDAILEREGGWVDRAEDRGGPTNMGITIGTAREVWGTTFTVYQLRNITMHMAEEVYRNRYAAPFEGIIDDDLFDLVVDTAVNNGRGRAAIWLQRAAGVVEDGSIGPVTLAKVNAWPVKMYYGVIGIRMKAYGALISQNHSQAIFAAGWLNRLAEFVVRDLG
jgi:lysozyme family protein